MTCLNEVLSITVVKCDSLINKVSFPRDSHYFKIRGPGPGGAREGVEGEQVVEEWGGVGLQLSSYAVHKHRHREASVVLALNQVRENWQ